MRGTARIPSAESDFWGGLFLDLSVRIEWLGQALEAVPRQGASASAHRRLEGYARALDDLHRGIERVQSHRADPRLKPLFSLEGPLAAYLSRLYAWCDEVGSDFERMAASLRRREATSIVFSHRAINHSYAQFDELVGAMRHAADVARELHGSGDADAVAWRAFDHHLEELVWATEWLHMALARPPGE